MGKATVKSEYAACRDAFVLAASSVDADASCLVDDGAFLERLAANMLGNGEYSDFIEHMASCAHCRERFSRLVTVGVLEDTPFWNARRANAAVENDDSIARKRWNLLNFCAKRKFAISTTAALLALGVGVLARYGWDKSSDFTLARFPSVRNDVWTVDPARYDDDLLDYFACSILSNERFSIVFSEEERNALLKNAASTSRAPSRYVESNSTAEYAAGDVAFARLLNDVLVEHDYQSALENALDLKATSDDYEIELMLGATELGLQRYAAAKARFEDALAFEDGNEIVELLYSYALSKTHDAADGVKSKEIAEKLMNSAKEKRVRKLAALVFAIEDSKID